ncbi:MAG: hypothetical protein AAF702_45930 [Chloroflexota bacterium]
MKRKLSAITIIVGVLMSLMVIPVSAQGPPGTGWWVFWQIQNIDTTAGQIQMTAYQREGDGTEQVGSESFDIGVGNALAYNPGQTPNIDNGLIGFSGNISFRDGSAVISSDRSVVAVAQLGNNRSGTAGTDGGTATSFYQGIGSGNASTTVNFPLVKNNFNGQTTTFYIQAAGADANVTITYNMNDGTTHTETRNIAANRMWQFSPSNASPAIANSNCGAGGTSPCQGAATAVSSSGPIVGVVVEHPDAGAPAALALSTRGLTATDQGTKLLAPIIKNDFNGSTTGFSVQNTDASAAASVEIVLTVTNSRNPDVAIGAQFRQTVSIEAGKAVVFNNARNNIGGMGTGTFASATVESLNGQKLVGTVNENNNGKKAVYAAFCIEGCGADGNSTPTTTKVAAPLVKDFFRGKTTGITVANAGTASTKIKASYTDAGGTVRVIESSAEVAPGGAVSFFSIYTNPSTRFAVVSGFTDFADFFDTKNSVIVESSDGTTPIVAVAQESARDTSGLDIKNYEGFNY